jgi:hypothetical protein
MPFPFSLKCCCCKAIFYGDGADGLGDCYGSGTTELAQARLAFAGTRSSSCSDEFSLSAPVQTALKAWVEAGGRLFLTADNITCFNLVYATNQTNYNNFLGFLGSAMQLTNNFPFGCPETSDCADATALGIGIMEDLPAPIRYLQGGEISGGTPLAHTSTIYTPNGCDVPHVLMAAEEIGDGLVVACASSYVFGITCEEAGGSCEFLTRLCNWTVARILAEV